jgi:menaquinol-cytochrome c reductase iron-sulfur subunit
MMGAIAAALGIPAAGYLLVPGRRGPSGGWVEAAELPKLVMNQPEQIVFERVRRDGWKTIAERTVAWVVRTEEKKVVAFSPICTHLGCAVSWDTAGKTFVCHCHTSAFSKEGMVLGGPAPRPLDRFLVRIDGEKVLLGQVQKSVES